VFVCGLAAGEAELGQDTTEHW